MDKKNEIRSMGDRKMQEVRKGSRGKKRRGGDKCGKKY
jgi:hypothetical protein